MKRILVIGGSYFAGRVFVETLSQWDHFQIYVFNRGTLPIGVNRVNQLTGDRELPANISQAIPNLHWDAVVDFCAYNPKHIHTILNSIYGSIGHYIFISTTSVYAPSEKSPVAEDATKMSGPMPELGEFSDYGYLKWLAECELERECRQKNINYTILRPSIIYGRYNYAPRESLFFDHAITGTPMVVPDNPNIFYSFTWVDDLAEIVAACLENDNVFGQAYNVANEEMISYNIMADFIEDVCGREIKRSPLSVDEMVRQRAAMPFPPDQHLLYDGHKLRRVLQYEHTPFIIGIAKTWQDYQKVVQRRIQAGGVG